LAISADANTRPREYKIKEDSIRFSTTTVAHSKQRLAAT
jgi:hypothetical protein